MSDLTERRVQLAALEEIQQRVLYLAVRMVDHANHGRPNIDGIKVGGHQASSASMVTLSTALWFAHLDEGDLVSMKPHASPVFHAIQYLLGRLDQGYLKTLREFGGLQSYPSRTKDPDPVDFSTGSVGLGAAAPLFAAAVRRYTDAHFSTQATRDTTDSTAPAGQSTSTRTPRFVALMGDAELDEGNIWEAIADPAVQGLSKVLWVVDLNRQSLDRVVPGIKSARLQKMFADNGWNVVEAKYGRLLQAAFARPGGDALRRHIDEMPNELYQSYFSSRGPELRERFYLKAPAAVKVILDEVSDEDLAPLIQNLGGHDLSEMISAYRQADACTTSPTVVFAYTVKGWGLPIAGDPLNHAALLSAEHVRVFRDRLGLNEENEWDRLSPESAAGQIAESVRVRLGYDGVGTRQSPISSKSWPKVPIETGVPSAKPVSTQESFGRILVNLAREPEVARRMVTTAPDVAVSTNLGGWINKVGVFTPEPMEDLRPGELLKWIQGPTGQHIELGLSEMNLFLLLGMLGLSHDHGGEPLLPIGTVYDPFVCRGLDAFIYAVYSGARFIVAGTPAGITLSYEGGAHQSTITASIGLELPNVCFAEPAYAGALDWILCDALGRLGDDDGEAMYLRLTTRPLDQTPFETAMARLGHDQLRADVLAGAYRLIESPSSISGSSHGTTETSTTETSTTETSTTETSTTESRPLVQLAGSGATLPELIAAAAILETEGVSANVIDVTSLDRIYRSWRRSVTAEVGSSSRGAAAHHLARLIPRHERSAPIITVHDSSPHTMAWLGSVFGTRTVPLGVDSFGQSGSISELYRLNGIDTDSIVTASLLALEH
jgi:pyruvate dehydrogenase E1 component